MFCFIRKSRLLRLEQEVARLSREVLLEHIGICSYCNTNTSYRMGPNEAELRQKGDKCICCKKIGTIQFRPAIYVG